MTATEDDDTPTMVLRFSSMATVAVLAAGATGIALAWSEVRTLHALTSTGYGRVLMAKVAVVIVIGGLGAYNHFRLMPALKQGKSKAALRRLGRTLRARDPRPGGRDRPDRGGGRT